MASEPKKGTSMRMRPLRFAALGVLLAAANVLLRSPALLVLGSKASWWVPQWLDKILPHLDIEGKSAQTATPTPSPQAPPVTSS